MRVVAIVQARVGSSRLPGKALLSLAGRPMIEHVLERVQAIAGLTEVVLATSWAERDEALVTEAHRLGVLACRGSEADVLQRMHDAARWRGADVIVRVTADCPFLDPVIARKVLDLYRTVCDDADYVSNDTLQSGYPDGTDVEVFSYAALRDALRQAHVSEREHVTTWIRRALRCRMLQAPHQRWAGVKLSVDTQTDYQQAVLIADRLARGDYALASTMAALEVM